MKTKLVLLICLVASVGVVAQQRAWWRRRRARAEPASVGTGVKGTRTGWVGEAWNPHEGGLLRVKVHLRFGVEPLARRRRRRRWKPMPAGWYFGRVSMVANDLQSNVYVLHRNGDIDPLVVFDAEGNYLRSWGKGVIGDPHGIRVDRENNVWVVDRAGAILKYTTDRQAAHDHRHQGGARQRRQVVRQPDRPRLGLAGQHLHRRRLRQQPRREVRQERQVRHVVGHAGQRARASSSTVHSIQFDSKDRAYVSDRENNRIQIFDTNGKLLKTWNHLGSTQGIWISPKDEMYILTHRNNVENITADTLAGRLMKIDLESGKVLGSMESPGHSVNGSPNGDIFVGSLTGNVLRWMPHPEFTRSH